MIEKLIDGERRPAVLADLAKSVLRKKIPDLSMALQGRFGDQHALMCRLHLDHIDHLTTMIARLETEIEQALAPFTRECELLATIPGLDPRTAAAIIAEIGVNMAMFPTAAHLASWAGLCPGNHESAGKRNSANSDLFYGKAGTIPGSDKENQETSMLALHLLQSALVFVNTLLVQSILKEPEWAERLTDADKRGLSPLFWSHANLYGTIEIDMDRHLDLGLAA